MEATGRNTGRTCGGAVTVSSPAKVNLHLGVHPGRDGRGYHQVDSVMVALKLCDRVTVQVGADAAQGGAEARDGICVRMSRKVDVPPEKNAAWIAASRFREVFGTGTPISIGIEKVLPPQSGLGGASSNAAAVLLALGRLFSLSARDFQRLAEIARTIGADVPFFLNPAPAYMSGAGDVLAETLPWLPELPLVVARPTAGVSTVLAYRAFDEQPCRPREPFALLEALRGGNASGMAALLYNNLEPAALRLVPEIANVKAFLLGSEGALAGQVSGSGSCVFVFFDSVEHARKTARAAREMHGWWAHATSTVGKDLQFC